MHPQNTDITHADRESNGVSHDIELLFARQSVDVPAAERAVTDLLEALGVDMTREGIRDTPRRVAHAMASMITPTPFQMTTFANEDGYKEIVLVKNIPFFSLCEHHLLPFMGVAHVGYIPGESILGLSKLARVVEQYARDLQVQERLTMQIAQALDDHLSPQGVGVVLEAEHLCMSLRGVATPGTKTLTTAFRGVIKEDGARTREFLAMAGIGTANT